MNFCSMCYKEHLIKAADHAAAAPGPVAEKEIEDAKAAAADHAAAPGPVAEKKIEDAKAAAADHVREQSTTGQDPDTAAAAAVATTTPVAAAVSETGVCVQTTRASSAAVECANGCGFFGSAATNDLCSACYRDFLKNVHAAPAPAPAAVEAPAVKQAAPNRCASCRKKVGLLGFPCRCGGTFCSLHRYADDHACDFDYKTADREKLAKNNPLVVAAKINKI